MKRALCRPFRPAALLLAAAALTAACVTPPPPPPAKSEPEAPSIAETTVEMMVLLESNKDRCLEQARALMMDPVDWRNRSEREAAVRVGGKNYRPETLRAVMVTLRIRRLVSRTFSALRQQQPTDRDWYLAVQTLMDAERKLCQLAEWQNSRPPAEDDVSRALSTFLGELKTLSRAYPVSDEARATVLAKYEGEVQEALASAEDKIAAAHEARQIVETSDLDRELSAASFFDRKQIAPRPLSEAEIAAAGLAAGYLEQGPRAWRGRFATGSGWAALAEAELVGELLARLGPNSGVSWSQRKAADIFGDGAAVFAIEHASGFDETVLLEMWQEEGAWKIARLVTNVDLPPDGIGLTTAASEARAAPGAGPEPVERLAGLAPLKEALADGGVEAPEPRFEEHIRPADGAGQVAALWRAQWLLQRFDLDGAEQALQALAGSRRPLLELLEARLTYYRGRFDDLEPAYVDAQFAGIDHDGLRLEALQAYAVAGLEVQAEIALEDIGEMGSRQSEPYFELARLHVRNGRLKDAETTFLRAWQLGPLPRRTVFEDGILSWMAAKPEVLELLEVSSATEPLVASERGARAAATLPEGFQTTVSGELLQVVIGDSELQVPGGALLAPATARVAPAPEVLQRAERAALARLEQQAGNPQQMALALTHPRSATTLLALARDRRWDRVLELTEGVLTQIDRVPPMVVKLRAIALCRRNRNEEAKKLLLTMARNDRANKRRDPEMFFHLGELLARTGEYDLAIRLIERGNVLSSLFGRPLRIKQIRLEQKLAEDDNTYVGQGFALRYPRVSGKDYPAKVTRVLKAERRRIGRWIPIDPQHTIKVDLYPFLGFMEAYGEPLSIVGLFDGRVRVPFADLQSLHPQIVTILSHELAHAMIAAKTNDNAPKWLHEGLAQHIEMEQPVNPIPELAAKGRVLSLPVVEAVLEGMNERQFVELAYTQSAWALHYVESAFGVAGIHRLLDEFAAGATTEEAIERALGVSLVEFDRRVWEWCANDAPAVWAVEVHRYDRELNGLIARASAAEGEPETGGGPSPRSAPRGVLSKPKVTRVTVGMWHRSYEQRVRPIHSVLVPVLDMATGQKPWDGGGTCQSLLREIDRLGKNMMPLQSPDAAISRALFGAFGTARELAASCTTGPTERTPGLVQQTLAAFQAASRELGRYGLKP